MNTLHFGALANHPQRRAARLWRTALIATATAVLVGSTLTSQAASAATAVVASDAFERTVASGWGSATSGGAYTGTASPDSMSVGSGVARLALGSNESVSLLLGTGSGADVRADVDVRLDDLSAGSYYAFVLRAQSDGSQYRGRLELSAAGVPSLAVSRVNGRSESSLGAVKLSSAMIRSTWYTLSFTVTGSSSVTIQASLTPTGKAAAGPQLNVTDSSASRIATGGRFGWWSYINPGAPADTVLSLDNLTFNNGAGPLSGGAAAPTPAPSTSTAPAPAPSTSTAPAPAPTSPEPAPATPSSSGAGSAPVGTTQYAVPTNAIFVAPNAASGGDGSKGKPYSSVQTAVDSAKSGATIVLRGGTYHQVVTIPYGKPLTVQAYPNEAVWFDGSVPVTSWSKSGNVWISQGWTAQFSTDIEGGQNSRFIDAKSPMAASPDQLFIDGTAQRQVASAGQVTSGTFAVDYSRKQLIAGSDPTGRDVRASDLSQAFNVIAQDTTLQGFGVRRYATTYSARGTIRMQNVGAMVRNVVIIDNAMIGLTISNNNGTADHVTSQRNGLLGIGFDLNYNAVLRDSVITYNNSERFKPQPVSGGVKITRSRGVLIERNDISNNYSTGLWFDQSNYNVTVAKNTVNNNGAGVSGSSNIELEISDKAIVAGNQALGGEIGILIYNTGNVKIFNNEVGGGSLFGIKLAQDKRRPTDAGAVGLNPRVSGADPEVKWIVRNITVSNNVVSAGSQFSFYARDGESNRAVDTWNVQITGNLFTNKSAGGPTMVAWGLGDNINYQRYNTPAELASAKNSSWRNAMTAGAPTAASIAPDVVRYASTAVAVPADIASILGISTGTAKLGR